MKKILFFGFSLLLLISACKKTDISNPDPTPETMSDLNIAADFDWKTTRDIQITMTGKANNLVQVASPAGTVLQKAFLKANVPYTMKLTLPSYETSVRLKYMGQDVPLEIGNGNISYRFQ